MANKKYKLTDGNYWATDGIHDFGQNKTQREINAALVQADSDLSGAITSLGSDDIANDSTNVSGSKVTNALDTLNGAISKVVLQASVRTVSGNGTTSSIALTGLTANHVVGNWGMFSDANCTIPIAENSPTCNLTITTGDGVWSYTVADFTSTFYLRPTFILKQN